MISCFRGYPFMYSDLNDFLADLDRRKLLARVAEPVSPKLEMAAVIDRACKSPGGGPALLFEKAPGFEKVRSFSLRARQSALGSTRQSAGDQQ